MVRCVRETKEKHRIAMASHIDLFRRTWGLKELLPASRRCLRGRDILLCQELSEY